MTSAAVARLVHETPRMEWMLLLTLLLLGLITLVGHGIWVFLSLIIRSIFGGNKNDHESSRSQPEQPNIRYDAEASYRLLEHLRQSGDLTEEQHQAVCKAISQRVAASWQTASVTTGEELAASAPATVPSNEASEAPPAGETEGVTFAEVVTRATATEPKSLKDVRPTTTEIKPPPVTAFERPLQELQKPIESDFQPSAEAPVGNLGLKEILAAFMREKNIRWGELVSGILIIGSAIGLVISLRDQLREQIPYFPALMFLLLTGSVHAAGIYTLRRWKLRDTSRGVLIIGLLLVPLSFLAACTLAEHRELADPTYWLALVIGLASFSGMTALAGQALLRRGWWPLWIAVIGGGVCQLWFNRVIQPELSSSRLLLLSAPAITCFVVGLLYTRLKIWHVQSISSQTSYRLLLAGGIAVFSVLTSLVLLILRSGDVLATVASLSPWLSAISIIVSWVGWVIFSRVVGRRAKFHSTLGATFAVLGTALCLIATLYSTRIPSVLVITGIVNFGLLIALSTRRSMQGLIPIAWTCAGLSATAVSGHLSGEYQFDALASATGHRDVILSTWTPYLWLALSLVVGVAYQLIPRRFASGMASKQRLVGMITSGAFAVAAGFLAVLISFLRPDDLWNMHSATLMLLLVQIGVSLISLRSRSAFWPHLNAGWLLLTLLHAFYWNPLGSQWSLAITRGIECRWGLIAAVIAFLSAVLLQFNHNRFGSGSVVDRDRMTAFSSWSLAGSLGCVAAGIFTVHHLVGLGTVFTLVAALSCLMTAQATREKGIVWSFGILSTLCVALAACEFSSFFGIRPGLLGAWWVLVIAMSIWSAAWKVIAAYAERAGKLQWLLGGWPRFDHLADGVALGTALVFGALTLVPGVVAEISREATTFSTTDWERGLSFHRFLALASLGIAQLCGALEKPRRFIGLGLVLYWTVCFLLLAYGFETSRSTASAVRWLTAISGTLFCVLLSSGSLIQPVWARLRSRLGLVGRSELRLRQIRSLTNSSLSIVVGIVVILTSVVVIYAMLGGKMGGPTEGSFFASLPKEVSYATPVVLIVFTLLAYAIGQRRSLLASCGSAVFQYFVGLALVLLFLSTHPVFATQWFARILQAACIGMSIYGLVWHRFEKRIVGSAELLGRVRQLEVHTLVNLGLALALPLYAILAMLNSPLGNSPMIAAVGAPLGYCSLIGIGILSLLLWRDRIHLQGWGLSLVGCSVISTLACSLRSLPGVHGSEVLIVGLAAVALAVAIRAAFCRRDEGPGYLVAAASVLLPTGFVLAFSIRFAYVVELSPWLSIIPLAAVSLSILGLAIKQQSGHLAAASAGLTIACVTLMHSTGAWPSAPDLDLWQYWILASLATGLVWSIAFVGLGGGKRRRFDNLNEFTEAVGMLGAGALLWIGAASVLHEFGVGTAISGQGSMWIAVLYALFLIVSLWNAHFTRIASFAYVWVIGCVLSLDPGGVTAMAPLAIRCWALAITVGLAGLIWWQRSALAHLGRYVRIPRTDVVGQDAALTWPIAGSTVGIGVLIGSSLLVLVGESLAVLWTCPLLVAAGLLPMAIDRRHADLKWLVAVFASSTPLLISWSAARAPEPLSWDLDLMLRSLLASGCVAIVFGFEPLRRSLAEDWRAIAGSVAVAGSIVSIVLLAMSVALETAQFDALNGTGTAALLALLVGAINLGLVTSLVAAALQKSFDPLQLPEPRRQTYVYCAQLVLLLTCLHLYFCLPWLFQFGIKDYWPYLAMLVAFTGAGLSELARRHRLTVLADPLFNTAILLPILLAFGFWSVRSEADAAATMLLAGVFFMLVSGLRSSAVFGLLAFAFGNLALWLFYGKFPSLALNEHPQLWMIPPAISALVASQMNRHRLNQSQLATVRYLSMAVIYLSSTGEIFMHGIADRLWPPMVLSLLSVFGILVGMALRVRAFLYFGTIFLLMSVVAMVSHAQQSLDHIWPWWAFGIALGASILVLFGLFEKKRNQLGAIAKQLAQWDY